MSILNQISKTLTKGLQLFRISQCLPQASYPNGRNIWGYVAVAFNQVDAERLAKVGPNRLCAEWIVKNGGGVRFVDNPTRLWKDYNSLPAETSKFSIKVVDATNASIMKIGLAHFKGCNSIDTVIFHNCKHLEDDGLEGLTHIKNSLERLQVSGCYNISDSGLGVISELKNLKQLLIFDMLFVKNMQQVALELKKHLPECDIKATKMSVQLKEE
ncbi:ATP synthase subunit s, mitochondrial [Drosophila guanche]|uniref:Blast:ATP synthase subunit s, mitochondrial n=1 Tax=Drosophila guanche TaxID=7266 RepID=A0A3B0JNM8_DROGU|nr:ATP synthase subunit s, mitochondrial [Drosophila guanche]SPP72808.1 blast:ATP synthase subunit s%2C mitochondrial [Drosophila guanche]